METVPPITAAALKFERETWTSSSTQDSSFYTVSDDTGQLEPGTWIKFEDANPADYFLPPSTALTRFVYQSERLDGSKVPVSGCILWPFLPQDAEDGHQVVAFAHGTLGLTALHPPSRYKNIWQHFLAPYQLVLRGYVVVCTDYAGLGVAKDASGNDIVHEYLAHPSQAKDVLNSVKAVQSHYTELSRSFVVVGHSQGGGAAWGCAQLQAKIRMPGYLGAVAISPVTRFASETSDYGPSIRAAATIGMAAYFGTDAVYDILTEEGREAVETIKKSECGVASALTLLLQADLLKPDWASNRYIKEYQEICINGGKEIRGALLVIHGETDPLISSNITLQAVDSTIDKFPSSQIQYILLPGITHVPALTAGMSVWIDWIADRFDNKPFVAQKNLACKPLRPIAAYLPEQNWYLASATEPYMAP